MGKCNVVRPALTTCRLLRLIDACNLAFIERVNDQQLSVR
jgi:hypothetical protein